MRKLNLSRGCEGTGDKHKNKFLALPYDLDHIAQKSCEASPHISNAFKSYTVRRATNPRKTGGQPPRELVGNCFVEREICVLLGSGAGQTAIGSALKYEPVACSMCCIVGSGSSRERQAGDHPKKNWRATIPRTGV